MSQYISQLLIVVGALVVLTNIITQVLKQFTRHLFSTNILALGVSLVLSVIASIVWKDVNHLVVPWYYYVGSVILGFLVSYAAMFGFDKLKEALMSIGGDSNE